MTFIVLGETYLSQSVKRVFRSELISFSFEDEESSFSEIELWVYVTCLFSVLLVEESCFPRSSVLDVRYCITQVLTTFLLDVENYTPNRFRGTIAPFRVAKCKYCMLSSNRNCPVLKAEQGSNY